MIGPKKLEEITEKAAIAFWKSVAEQLPDYKAENLDHGTAILLEWQMKEAIQRFVQSNLKAAEEPNPDNTNSNGNGFLDTRKNRR